MIIKLLVLEEVKHVIELGCRGAPKNMNLPFKETVVVRKLVDIMIDRLHD
jgi:hypothetical protein